MLGFTEPQEVNAAQFPGSMQVAQERQRGTGMKQLQAASSGYGDQALKLLLEKLLGLITVPHNQPEAPHSQGHAAAH